MHRVLALSLLLAGMSQTLSAQPKKDTEGEDEMMGRRNGASSFIGVDAWNAWSAWSPWYVSAYPHSLDGFTLGLDFGTYFPIRASRYSPGWRR